jgi:hypothetical protein
MNRPNILLLTLDTLWADRRIFGELNGQAWDGFAADGDGRSHFFGQIRFPMGIYHAIWDGRQWMDPSLIHLIQSSQDDSPDGRIAAHNTYPIIRTGNEIILTLTDPPSESELRLFVRELSLDDVPELPLKPVLAANPVLAAPSPTPDTSPQL